MPDPPASNSPYFRQPRLPLCSCAARSRASGQRRGRLLDPEGNLLHEESFEDKGFDHAAATQAMMRIGPQRLGGRDISAVGHRVVHGGAEYSTPLLLTDQVIENLATLIPLAPFIISRQFGRSASLILVCRKSPVSTPHSIVTSLRLLKRSLFPASIQTPESAATASMVFPMRTFRAG
jgi:hypothetical protein